MGTVTQKERKGRLDIEAIRREFPMLEHRQNGKVLVYLDSAATGQKPRRVMDRLYTFYTQEYAKPKEEHSLSQRVTQELEETRSKVARFMGASSSKEIVFTRGCTESLNIAAGSLAKGLLREGDEVLITQLEHHANIVPWIMACREAGARLVVAPITPSGELDLPAFERLVNERTRVVAVSHSSHVLGTILPVQEIGRMAHRYDAAFLVDGAQTAPHMPIDMQEIDCDFYTFSGHKMGTPSGVGVLYGKKKWLEKLPPLEGGGDMATQVTFTGFEDAGLPEKFEAGTSPFAEIIAFGTLIDYVNTLDMKQTSAYEKELLHYATERLSVIPGLTIMGTAPEKEPVLSFHIEGKKMKKLEQYMSREHNIMIRSGDLTAQPLMEVLGVKELARISFCYYNTMAEVDSFVAALLRFLDL